MQVLANTSFGTLWLYPYNLGTKDAKGLVITLAISTKNEDGPYCLVFFTQN